MFLGPTLFVQYVFKVVALLVMMGLAAAVHAATTITVNGQTIHSSGGRIIVTNGTVIVDGASRAANVTQGSGKPATEKRALDNFTRLHLDISADVTVTQGDNPQCTITTDDNLLPLILTQHADNTLRISADESYSTRLGVKIAIEVPKLTGVHLNGSGVIRMTGVTEGELALTVNGSGDVHAKGKVVELMAVINGSGNVYAADLHAARATLTLNGSGNADIHVSKDLALKVNGSGGVTYSGDPARLSTSLNGSGRIRKH